MSEQICMKDGDISCALADPIAIWDYFPCPPPWNQQLLFKLDYKNLLNPEDGLKIILRIAQRCDVPVPEMLIGPGRLAQPIIFADCDTNCVNAVVFPCLVIFIVMVIIVIFLIRRQQRFRLTMINGRRRYCQCDNKERNGNIKICNGMCEQNIGKYTKKGSLPRRHRSTTHSDKSSLLGSTYKQFPSVDVIDFQTDTLTESSKPEFHLYEDLEKYNSRIDEFTLLRKAFKKYYGKDIDFTESPYSRKTEETYACDEDLEIMSRDACDDDMEIMSRDDDMELMPFNNECQNDLDANSIPINHYDVPQNCRDDLSECEVNCDLMINESPKSDENMVHYNTTNHIYATVKKRALDPSEKYSYEDDIDKYNTLKSTHSNDSDPEVTQLRHTGNSTCFDFPHLRVPHAYERLVSTTSNRTDVTCVSEESIELFVPERNNEFSTFK